MVASVDEEGLLPKRNKMKWSEFKKRGDEAIAEADLEDAEIDYIDMRSSRPGEVDFFIDREGELTVT